VINYIVFIFLFYFNLQDQISQNNFEYTISNSRLVKTQTNKILILSGAGYKTISDTLFTPYNNSIDASLFNLNFEDFNYGSIGEQIYLVSPRGGIVYEFKEGFLNRVDSLSVSMPYLSSEIFVYDKSLYLVGGYGAFSFTSQLLKFDFAMGKWSLVTNLIKDESLGFGYFTSVIKNDILYVFDTELENNLTGEKTSNDRLFTYDFVKSKAGSIKFNYSNFDFIKPNDSKNNTFSDNGKLYFLAGYSTFDLLEFDFDKNELQIFDLQTSVQSRSTPIKIENEIYTLVDNILDPRLAYLRRYPIELRETNSLKPFLTFKIFIGLIILFFILAYVLRKKKFSLKKSKLYYGSNFISLDRAELFFMKTIIKNREITNSEIISYFNQDNKTLDLNIKRKNKMIRQLTYKVQDNFNVSLFKKIKNDSDKRQGSYLLIHPILINKKFDQ